MSTPMRTNPFVGREQELAALEALLTPAGGAAMIHAEQGMGKSALLRELERRAEHKGWEVPTAAGAPGTPHPSARTPLALLGEALTPKLAARDRAALLVATRGAIDDLERLWPEV